MSVWGNTATVDGGIPDPPPGWARWSDHIRARLRGRSIDDQLLDGSAAGADPVVIVRRARLTGRRYRSALAAALRGVVASANGGKRDKLGALPLRRREVLESGPLILTLADELEAEERVSPRGVILADRLIRDGDSPIYGPLPVSRRYDASVETAIRHARAALHLG